MYTSPEKIRQKMRKLPQSITNEEIQEQIDKAAALIDGKLGEVYKVPFFPVPKLIESITADLTVFFLAEDLYTSNQPNMDQYQEKRYERAMELLNKIFLGEVSIGIPLPNSGFASTNEDDPIFTLEEPYW